jgi:hypothetical protein
MTGEAINVVSWDGIVVNLVIWFAVMLGLFRYAHR